MREWEETAIFFFILLLLSFSFHFFLSFAALFCFSRKGFWAGEMAQRLKELTAVLKVLSSIPSNHMMAHTHL